MLLPLQHTRSLVCLYNLVHDVWRLHVKSFHTVEFEPHGRHNQCLQSVFVSWHTGMGSCRKVQLQGSSAGEWRRFFGLQGKDEFRAVQELLVQTVCNLVTPAAKTCPLDVHVVAASSAAARSRKDTMGAAAATRG